MQSQRDFFHAVLPQDGLPCIAWVPPSGGIWQHRVFNNIQELCNFTSQVEYSANNYYFCISTLANTSVVVKGKEQVRVQANALSTRCLVLDIDLKDGNYSSNDEVLLAVNTFAETFNLPKPIAVSSGYGVHAYWPFAIGIPSAEWAEIARHFKKTVKLMAPALAADASRISDSAGVLRIPDSYNLKYGARVPVSIIQWSDETSDVGAIKSSLHMSEIGIPLPKPINLSTSHDSNPVELSKVAKNCNWLGTYIKNQAAASEPEWYAILGLTPYLVHNTDKISLGNEAVAQLISSGHPSYSKVATQSKYLQVKTAQTGPTTCNKFRDIDAERCVGCPFAAAVKTPIQTATLDLPATAAVDITTKVIDEGGNVTTDTVTIPLPPAPYFRGKDGGVYVNIKEKDTNDFGAVVFADSIKKVYDYDLYPNRRYRTELVENEIMEIHLWLPHDGLRIFKMPTALLAEQKKLAYYLAEKGVIPAHGSGLIVAKYMVDYIRYLQTIGAAEVEFSRFGWRDLKSDSPKFVLGNGFIDKEGTLISATYAHFLKGAARAAVTAGTLEGWKKGFAGYKGIPDSEPHLLAAMAGFAAPLMAFTEYSGVLYNMVGESAAGKSTALKFMTSIFGAPNPQHVLAKDTEIAMFNFIGYLNAIPVAMDELTNLDPDKLSNFALNFTGGRGKMRASRDGQNQQNEVEWDTIVVSTSNTSMYDKLASHRKGYSAEAMRILEVDVKDSHPEYKHQIDIATALLNDNYGHAGRVFITYVIKNRDTVRAAIDAVIKKITVAGAYKNEERFWVALWACVFVGGQIAKNLGLHDYDMNKLLNWGKEQITKVRASVKSSTSDPVSILSDFFNSNLDTVLKFDKAGNLSVGPNDKALVNMRAVKVRIELDINKKSEMAFISTPAIREHCAAKKVDPSWLIKCLTEIGVITETNVSKRLAAGSGLDSLPVKCWKVNMRHTSVATVLDSANN